MLDDVARIGPFFVLRTPGPDERDAWVPFRRLHDDPGPLGDRIARVRSALGSDDRVAASIAFQGLVARLVAAPLAAVVLHGVLPDPAGLSRRPDGDDPWEPGLPDVTGTPTPDPAHDPEGAAGLVARELLDGTVAPLLDAVRGLVPVSAHVLWGNVASSLSGAGRVLDPARPGARPALLGLLGGLLGRAPLAGTGRLLVLEEDRPDTEWGFRRRSLLPLLPDPRRRDLRRLRADGAEGVLVQRDVGDRDPDGDLQAGRRADVLGDGAADRGRDVAAPVTEPRHDRDVHLGRVAVHGGGDALAAQLRRHRRGGRPAAGDPQQRLLQVRSQPDHPGHPARRPRRDPGHRLVADVEPDRWRVGGHGSSHTSTTWMSTRATGTPNARSPVEISTWRTRAVTDARFTPNRAVTPIVTCSGPGSPSAIPGSWAIRQLRARRPSIESTTCRSAAAAAGRASHDPSPSSRRSCGRRSADDGRHDLLDQVRRRPQLLGGHPADQAGEPFPVRHGRAAVRAGALVLVEDARLGVLPDPGRVAPAGQQIDRRVVLYRHARITSASAVRARWIRPRTAFSPAPVISEISA